jgi:hypothetical protein
MPWAPVKVEQKDPVPAPTPGFPVAPEGSTPGIGMSGTMFCPRFRAPCMKNACMFWVELTYAPGTKDERRVGHCTDYWQTIVMTEWTDQLKKLTLLLSRMLPSEKNGQDP